MEAIFFKSKSKLTFINFKIFITKILYIDNLELPRFKILNQNLSIHKSDKFSNFETVIFFLKQRQKTCHIH
jgi:hypothetical protein